MQNKKSYYTLLIQCEDGLWNSLLADALHDSIKEADAYAEEMLKAAENHIRDHARQRFACITLCSRTDFTEALVSTIQGGV